MHVALLRGENFRLYPHFEIAPDPRLNLFIGPNAAGKTSILEALFVAARGRSFRTADLRRLAGSRGPDWQVFVRTSTSRQIQSIGAGWSGDGLLLRRDGQERVSLAEVVRDLPVQLLDPLSHRVVEEGPAYRRGLIDWGVFHVEHRFLEIWRRYVRALRQRNAAIRLGQPLRAVQAWDCELGEAGDQVDDLRQRHVREVQERFDAISAGLLPEGAARLEWHRGWPGEDGLAVVLAEHGAAHVAAGTTGHGPHRADLRIQWADRRARDRLSRGQQKMLVVALLLAQTTVMQERGLEIPVLLVDDFSSELGSDYQMALARALVAYPGQCWITAFETPAALASSAARVFHVEHGTIRD